MGPETKTLPDIAVGAESLVPISELDRPGEECGVLGIWLTEEGQQALKDLGVSMDDMLYAGLETQRNRGQQSTGMSVSTDGINFDEFNTIRGNGTPKYAFGENGNLIAHLPPDARYGIGHNRYTTVGGSAGAGPIRFSTSNGDMVMSHNGEFSNHRRLRALAQRPAEELPSDSWIVGSLVADKIDAGYAMAGALIRTMPVAEGSYSITSFHQGEMVGIRDPGGVRPLILGSLGPEGRWGRIHASETPALDAIGSLKDIGAGFIEEIEPGELQVINEEGVNTIRFAEGNLSLCAMEKIYLSNAEHLSTAQERYNSGRIMAREVPLQADLVVPILGSAKDASQGYADALGIPLETHIEKIRDERAFMAQTNRKHMAGQKLRIDYEAIRDKDIIIGDDSRVRGDTVEAVLERISGVARSVKVVVFSPEIRGDCDLGTDLKDSSALAANRMSNDEHAHFMGADGLYHLSMAGLKEAFGNQLCTGCFDGNYPNRPRFKFVDEVPVSLRANIGA